MVVPWPPDRAKEPMTTPAAEGMPKANAPAVPTTEGKTMGRRRVKDSHPDKIKKVRVMRAPRMQA